MTAALWVAGSAQAQTAHGSATWSPAPASGDWNTGTDWVPAVVPNGPADTATFGVSTTTAVALSQNTTVSGITFNATAAVNPYTITAAPGTTLTISGAGVVNNSGVAQTFVSNNVLAAHSAKSFISFTNSASGGASRATVFISNAGYFDSIIPDYGVAFHNNSTAGGATYIATASTSATVTGGAIVFLDSSNAGTSSVNANANLPDSSGLLSGGGIVFLNNSTAQNANISVDGGGVATSNGASVNFSDSSSAGSATITVRGDGNNNKSTDNNEGFAVFDGNSSAGTSTLIGAGGRIQFFDSSTAGNAMIRLTDGGVDFGDTASGGSARFIMAGSATLDISGIGGLAGFTNDIGDVIPGLPPASLSIGSIEGTGFVRLGENTLTVGTNNASTTFSGSITEGGREFNTEIQPTANGNAFIKAGTGTLTLSGASTYTGPTTVTGGTLSVTGSIVSPVTVNSGATLTNSGTIGGLTLATGGTLASTGTPATLTDTGAGSFAAGSMVNFDITTAGASDKIGAIGAVMLGGATLNIFAMPGNYTGTSYTLLTAGGGLTGVFNFGGITGGTFATAPTLTYTANSVLLNFAALAAATHGSAIWKLTPTSGDWNTAANWANNTVPNGPADTATFDKTSIPGVALSQNTEVNSIVFNPGAAANPYTITAAPGTTLTISGAGVVNNSGVTQNLVTNANGSTLVNPAFGTIAFRNNATVGAAALTIITNTGGAAGNGLGSYSGNTNFFDSSSAGAAIIKNNASTLANFFGGQGTLVTGDGGLTQFNNNSTAATATIYNYSSETGQSTGGITSFKDNASAGSSAIYGYGSSADGGSAATIVFTDSASAANAKITLTGNGANPINGAQAYLGEAYLVFNGNATAANATLTDQGGRIQFFDTATAGNALIQASSGGIDFGANASGGTARIVLSGTAALDISDVSNEVDTPAFKLTPASISIGSFEGSGFVRLGKSALTTGTNNLSTTFSGSITEGGRFDTSVSGPSINSLTKTGTGTLTLSGASTYTGPTTVTGGTLSVTGSVVSPVTVNSGATLTVSGRVGGVTLAQGSTLTTLGVPQTMTVTGAASFAAGSTVRLAVAPTGANDQIAVTGAAQLGGAALQVAASPGAYGTQRYTLLTAGGGVNGTFAFGGVTGLGTLSALVTPSLIYSANSVVLAFQRVQITGGTFNQRAVAGALNADELTAPFLTALTTNGLPSNAQLDTASGEIHATLRSALLDDGALLREATLDHLHAAATDPSTPAGVMLWADVRGDRLTLNGDGNAARAHAAAQAIVIGADYGLGAWRIGGGYANNWGRVTVAARGSYAKWTGDSAIAYVGGTAGPFALKAGASQTWYRLDTLRTFLVPAGTTTVSGAQDRARLGQVFAEAAIGVGLGGLRGEAFGRWSGERLTTDGFAENGGATALSSARHRNELSWSLAGARGTVPVGGAAAFTLSAGWSHLFGQATPSAPLADTSGTGFLVLGAPLARDSARVAAALSARIGGQVTARLGYTGEFAGGNTQHALNAGVAVRF